MNSVKAFARSFLSRNFPNQFNTIQAVRVRRTGFRLAVENGDTALAQKIIDRFGRSVLRGPFQGVRIPDGFFWPGTTQWILGSLEQEIHPALTEVLSRPYRTAVNVGCAEGNYAVGFAVKMMETQVVAFDIDPRARAYCRRYARTNGVEQRLAIRGTCTHTSLSQALAPGPSLLLCDVEGYEMFLLNPSKCAPLVETDIIVEIHEEADRRSGDELLRRFETSHDVQVVMQSTRRVEDFPELNFLSPEQQSRAIAESRSNYPQRWAFLSAKRKRD
jgi:hypothetical protein